MFEDDSPRAQTSNVTDDTRRDFYRQALVAKIAEESAKTAHASKVAAYRNILKNAKKAGVDSEAISETLKIRFADPDLVVIAEREKLKMFELSGVLPGIREKILGRLDIQEATQAEDHQNRLDRARDLGALAGRKGLARTLNEHVPGSELHQAWDRAWLDAQSAIAEEMATAEVPKAKRGRPKKVADALGAEPTPAVLN